MAGQVPEATACERLHALQALLFEQQAAFNASRTGMTIPVLLEKPGRFGAQATGRSPWLQPVHVEDAAPLIGQIVPVRIESGGFKSLGGKFHRGHAAGFFDRGGNLGNGGFNGINSFSGIFGTLLSLTLSRFRESGRCADGNQAD